MVFNNRNGETKVVNRERKKKKQAKKNYYFQWPPTLFLFYSSPASSRKAMEREIEKSDFLPFGVLRGKGKKGVVVSWPWLLNCYNDKYHLQRLVSFMMIMILTQRRRIQTFSFSYYFPIFIWSCFAFSDYYWALAKLYLTWFLNAWDDLFFWVNGHWPPLVWLGVLEANVVRFDSNHIIP